MDFIIFPQLVKVLRHHRFTLPIGIKLSLTQQCNFNSRNLSIFTVWINLKSYPRDFKRPPKSTTNWLHYPVLLMWNRSRTFNISDVQEPAMTIGSSRTLPKPHRPKLVELGSGTSSTTSSRKSSNTSSNSSQSCSGCSSCCVDNDKYEISQEALDEIAAFETFLEDFHLRQQQKSSTLRKNINNNKMLERQKKIEDQWIFQLEEKRQRNCDFDFSSLLPIHSTNIFTPWFCCSDFMCFERK